MAIRRLRTVTPWQIYVSLNVDLSQSLSRAANPAHLRVFFSEFFEFELLVLLMGDGETKCYRPIPVTLYILL